MMPRSSDVCEAISPSLAANGTYFGHSIAVLWLCSEVIIHTHYHCFVSSLMLHQALTMSTDEMDGRIYGHLSLLTLMYGACPVHARNILVDKEFEHLGYDSSLQSVEGGV